MKNVQIPLMIFILSLLLLSLSQSILQTVSPTNYSLHFKHIHCHVQSHINIANMPNHRLTQRYWGAASNSDTRVETSDGVCNSAKL